jgi:replication initiation and membrane attachment protein
MDTEISGAFISKGKSALIKFNSEFNMDLFINGLSKHFFDESVMTDKFKDTITKLAFTYNLNEVDMQDVYINSLTSKGKLDYKLLPKATRKHYQYKYSKKAPKLGIKDMNDSPLMHINTISPAELLEELSGMPAASSDLDIVYKLMSINKLTPELINTLIYYVLKVNNNKMPTYPYFEKIANEWGRAGIKTPEDAVEYINRMTVKKGSTKSKRIDKAKKPEWYKEYIEERKQKDEKIKIEDDKKSESLNLKDVSDMFNNL